MDTAVSVNGDIHVTGRVQNTGLLRRISQLELEVSEIRDKLAVSLAPKKAQPPSVSGGIPLGIPKA